MNETSTQVLVQQRDANVLVLRLNRPEARNAFDGALMDALGAAVLAAETDETLGAIVLTGTGDRAFCSGMDLRAFADGGAPAASTPERTEAFYRLVMGKLAIPLVGAAQATAVAGGLELLLACDVIVASSEAELGLPEVQRGLYAAGTGTTLGRRIPLAVAMELLLTGERISAARAREVGLINAVVPQGQVLAVALEFAHRIARNGPLALRATKELAQLAIIDAERHQSRSAHWQSVVFSSEDAREGASAFVERRDPVWKGR